MELNQILLLQLVTIAGLITASYEVTSDYVNRGLNPNRINRLLKEGCELEHVNLGLSSEQLSHKTMNDDEPMPCKASCRSDSRCEAGARARGSKTCDYYKEISFDFGSNNKQDLLYLRDCRRHVCADTCHCYDSDTQRDAADCYVEDEIYVRQIFTNSRQKLVKINSWLGPRLTANSLDKWLITISKNRSDIEVIVLRSDRIATLDKDSFFNFNNLRYLNLDDNEIVNISRVLFKDLRKLEALMLVNNRIPIIPPGTFRHLTSLKYLDLSNNPAIRMTSGVFFGLGALQTLHLKANSLFRFDNDVFDPLVSLTSLTLSGGRSSRNYLYHSYDAALLNPLKKLKSLHTPITYNPLIFQTPVDKFDLLCILGDCYEECNTLKPSHLSSQSVLYEFRYDLSQLQDLSKDVVVHAQTAYLIKDAMLQVYDGPQWMVYAREVHIEGYIAINATTANKLCYIGLGTINGKKIAYHFRYLNLEFYAEKIYIRPGSIESGICEYSAYVPELNYRIDVDKALMYLDDLVKCAELLSYSTRGGMAVDMLDYSDAVYSNNRTETITLKAVMLKSTLIERRLNNDEGSFVPLWSLNFYHTIYSRVANETKNEYDRFLVSQRSGGELSDIKGSIRMSLIKDNDFEVLSNERLLRINKGFIDEIRNQYAKAIIDANKAQERLLNGGVMKNNSSLSHVKGILNGVMTLFSSLITQNTADEFYHWDKPWKGFQEIHEILNDVTVACDEMINMFNAGKMDVRRVKLFFKDLTKASTLNEQRDKLDQIPSKVHFMLIELKDIDGLKAFEFTVDRLVAWGKQLAEITLSLSMTVRKMAEEAAMSLALKKTFSFSSSVSDKLLRQQSKQNQLAAVENTFFEMRLHLLEIGKLYCQAYRHYYLQPCKVWPSSTDDLSDLIRKALWSKGQLHSSLVLTMPHQPQRFEERIILEDEVDSEHCYNVEKCLVSTFIRTNALIYNITLNHPKFLPYHRVRVEEVKVNLVGVSGATVALRTSPIFLDRLRNTEIHFTTVPRANIFKHDTKTNVTNSFGTIQGGNNSALSEITPFTEWTIIFDERHNHGVDLTQLKKIEFVLSGNAVYIDPHERW